MKRPRGFAYLCVLILAAALTAGLLVVLDQGSLELAMARNSLETTRNEWLARAAVHEAAWRMCYDSNYRQSAQSGALGSPITDSLATGKFTYGATLHGQLGTGDWLLAGTGGVSGTGYTSRQRIPDSLLVTRLSLVPVADAMIVEDAPTANYGASPDLGVRLAGGTRRRMLLKFSFAGISPSINVTDAVLEVRLMSASGDESPKLAAYMLTRSWTEGTRAGSGVANGATWNYATSSTAWQSPGGEGDYANKQDQIQVPLQPGLYRWDVTDAVQRWIWGYWWNYGFLIRASPEYEQQPVPEDRVFGSRERDGGSVRAVLYITYS